MKASQGLVVLLFVLLLESHHAFTTPNLRHIGGISLARQSITSLYERSQTYNQNDALKIIEDQGSVEISPVEERVLDLIEHENDMIDKRMTWFLTFQGFLFAVIGLGQEADMINFEFLFIPASVSCLSIMFAILESDKSLIRMKANITHETFKPLCAAPDPGIFFGVAAIEIFRPKYSMPISILIAWTLMLQGNN